MSRLNELAGAMEVSPSKGFKGLLYSDSGNGKSHLAAEIADAITPEGKFWLLIDTSDNYSIYSQINSGRGPQRTWRRLPFTFFEDIEEIAEAIKTKQPGWADIATIVLDELSVMVVADIDRIFEAKGKDMLTETPDWGEYRPNYKRVQRMLKKLMEVPGLNIIMVAHEKGPVKDLTKQHADIPIASYKTIKQALTVVGRVTADLVANPGATEATYRREVQVHPTAAYDAKCRLGTPSIKFGTEFLVPLIQSWIAHGGEDIDVTPEEEEKKPEATTVENPDTEPEIDTEQFETL